MRSRLVLLLAVMVAAAAVALAAARLSSAPRPSRVTHASISSNPASYLGVYESGSPSSYQPVAEFAKAAGRSPNLVGYFSGWAEPFAVSYANQVLSHGAIMITQIDPSYASVQAIAAGSYDTYLRSFADSVRNFGHPVVLGFGHEMNAPWYPWGYQHTSPKVFLAAWRHIVTLFRSQGAENVTWMWTINADRSDTGPISSWWPGSKYVTWVGIDGYYYRPSDDFANIFGRTIGQVRGFTHKPVLLSETAVGPRADQPAKIANLFAGMARYRTLGLVWFDETQHRGIYHQDWRIEDHHAAQAAFERDASTLTLTRP